MLAAKFFRAVIALSLFAAIAVFAPQSSALAQDAETTETPADTPEDAGAALTGFRSAQFGMDEDAVLEAIKADFGLEGDAVNIGVNSVERTRVITISAPEILPEGGTAQVSYIFGYKSKALIQVGILWSPATDETITDATLYGNGDVLRSYFASAGYVPETITRDVALENGILLFRGSDASGHTAILLLQGRFEGEAGDLTLLPEALTLLYAVNPDDPDILTLNPGDF